MILKGHVYSEALEMETGISLVIPTEPDRSEPYKIAYVLHGLGGNSADIVNYTRLPLYAGKYHCIFVMPEAGRSIYADMVYGQKHFSYISLELPEICRSVFNIQANREDTFIIGNSLGGHGALKCALTYPDKYAVCCANAAGPLLLQEFLKNLREGRTEEYTEAWGQQFLSDYRAAFGENFAWKPENELLELAKKIQQPEAGPKIYAQCGTEDILLNLNRLFCAEMKELPLDFTYEEMPGSHNWYFFDEAIKRGLDFCMGSEKQQFKSKMV